MQLIEYFLWIQLEDNQLNYLFSVLGQLLIGIQPIASLFLLTTVSIRYVILLYILFLLFIMVTQKNIQDDG